MKQLNISYLIKSIIFVFAFLVVTNIGIAEGLSPNLEKLVNQYNESGRDSLIEVVLFFEDDYRIQKLEEISSNKLFSRSDRIEAVLDELQTNPVSKISRNIKSLSAKPVKEYWIVPAMSMQINLSQVDSIMSIEEVNSIVENVYLDYIAPVEMEEVKSAASLTASVTDQLKLLKVPSLWAKGVTGKGSLICSFDTGVEGTHEALQSKWRGNKATLSASWFSKDTPDSLPSDNIGHGTHTMGIMVGSTPTDSFGVAPGAEWISAGVVDQGRTMTMTLADILEAFQWALNPDGNTNTFEDVPDVILNSWGVPKGLFAPCDDKFNGVIAACEAAGIVTIFAAGNEGPDPMSMRYPADLAISPLNTFSVGAVDNFKVVANFSSRGPSSCDERSVKPEVVAPGMTIRSSYKGGGYFIMSGSSMAAPYVAGIVALLRQSYPNASVEEIKNAILYSAEDLGATGEDNNYGYGLVDAEKALELLSDPDESNFVLSSFSILNNGIALPGETFQLQLSLHNPAGNVEQVFGHIATAETNEIEILNNDVAFFFGIGGTNALSSSVYNISISENLYHGQQVQFELTVNNQFGEIMNTLGFEMTVGFMPKGKKGDHVNKEITLTVSDFGQYGLAAGSIYNAKGEGLKYNGSQNLLYESGIIVGRGIAQISSSVRDSNALFVPSDFKPVRELTDGNYGVDGGFHRTASFTDNGSPRSVPIIINQETIHFNNGYDDGIVIFKYFLRNSLLETLHDVSFGFFADFDLPGLGEKLEFNKDLNLIYQKNANGTIVGLVGLNNVKNFTAIENSDPTMGKTGFTVSEKLDLIMKQGVDVNSSIVGDMMFLASTEPFTLSMNDSIEVTYGLLTGSSVSEILQKASIAILKFGLLTDVNENIQEVLPFDFELNQNYPNPFNPTTSISFTIAKSSEVELTVFNMLGQEVKSLHTGYLQNGNHSIEWDGTNNAGMAVSSGVYFYRLSMAAGSETKKMVLLK